MAHSTYSWKSLTLLGLLTLSSAQSNTSSLESCLAAISCQQTIDSSSGTWSTETTSWQLRLKPSPALITYPLTREALASTLACAREADVKVSPTAAGHSFAAYGFGYAGNLVVNMSAFDTMDYDESAETITYGAGSRVGPVSKYLWDNYGRHFPHVRSGRVGLAGSSIGGGWGSTSRFLGTPMDNLVAVEIMLYNGTIVSAQEGSDIFWAVQGAAPSFGILLSLTTKTFKPAYDIATSFTLTFNGTVETIAKAVVASQEFSLTEGPDEFSLRWSLSKSPFSATGFFYGNPDDFESTMEPLLTRLNTTGAIGVKLTSETADFWTTETKVSGSGMNQTNGGPWTLGGRSFYGQALTITTDNPLTVDLVTVLYNNTAYGFNSRSDMSQSGLIDLWGGISRNVSDNDSAFQHGKNLWLIRYDGVSRTPTSPYPSDGVTYFKGLMTPFENALTAASVPLRGFANYRDTALTEEQWSQRLYGDNYARLQAIKDQVDPEGYFTSNEQSIPVPT